MYIHICHTHMLYLCICMLSVLVVCCYVTNAPKAEWLKTTTISHSSWILLVENLGGTQLGGSSVPHGIDQGHPGLRICKLGWCGRSKMAVPRVGHLGSDGRKSLGAAGTVDWNICSWRLQHGSLRGVGLFTRWLALPPEQASQENCCHLVLKITKHYSHHILCGGSSAMLF